MAAFNRMLGDKEQYIRRFEEMLPLLADTSELEKQLMEAEENHGRLLNDLRSYMEENTHKIQDQAEYNQKFDEMDQACKAAEEEIKNTKELILAQQGRKEQICRCLEELCKCGDILEKFEPALWNQMVETVTVRTDKTLIFCFRDKTEIPVKVPEKK